MRISKIEFENFRNFRDRGTIECSTDGKVTIIYGKNGDGKTTLHQLFQWIFYGRMKFNKTANDRLYNLKFEAEQAPESEFDVWGRIHFEHAGTKYMLRRTAHFKKSLLGETDYVKEELELEKQDEDYNWRKISNPVEAIEKLLPTGLSEYFFFDGESMIADLRVKGADSAKKLRAALYSMFDLDIIDMALDHIGDTDHKETVLGKLYLSKGENGTNSEISMAKANLENLQTNIDKIKDDLFKYRQDKKDKQALITQISEQIGSTKSKAEYERIRKQLQSSKDTNQKYLESMEQKFGDDLMKNYPGLLIAKAVDSARQKIHMKVDQAHIPAGLTPRLLDFLLDTQEGFCICGSPLCEVNRKKLEELRSLLPPKSYAAVYHDFMREAKKWYENYDREHLSEIIETAINARDAVLESEEAIREADAIQKKSSDVSDLVITRETAESQLHDLDEVISNREVELKKADILLKKRKKEFDELTDACAATKNAMLRIEIMEKVKEYFQKKMDNASVTYSQKLQMQIQSLLNIMLTARRKVNVTPEFSVRVTDSFQDESKSEGQFAVVSFAYIGGILKMLKSEPGLQDKEYPLILDGPFSKLDADQRQNVIDTIPSFAPQVILFSKDSLQDLFGESKLGKVWTIESNAEKNVACVKEGYKWN